jgi:hypothetical protein
VQITPPQLPAVDINALGTIASRATQRARASATRVTWFERHPVVVVAFATLLGAGAFLLGSFWQRQTQAAPADKSNVVLASPQR